MTLRRSVSVLAALVVPLALTTIYRAGCGRFDRERRLASDAAHPALRLLHLRKALRRHADDSRNWSGVHKLEGAGHGVQLTRLDLSRPRGLSYFVGDGQRSASLVRRSPPPALARPGGAQVSLRRGR